MQTRTTQLETRCQAISMTSPRRESSREEPPTATPIFDFDQTENCPSCWNSGTGRGPSNNRANRRTPLVAETKKSLAMTIWSSRRAGSILRDLWNRYRANLRNSRTQASRKTLLYCDLWPFTLYFSFAKIKWKPFSKIYLGWCLQS